MQLTIQLPPRQEQLAFNRKRWGEVLLDRDLADLPYRIETNEHGQILLTPPASGGHSTRQTRILLMLHKLLGEQPLAECPISTIAGPCNTDSEMQVKRQRYFEAGAEEVWLRELDGSMRFFLSHSPDIAQRQSLPCPNFPTDV